MTEVFRNAPITEALIDIRAVLPEAVNLADLEALHDLVAAEYPEKQPRTLWEGSLELRGANEPRVTAHSQSLGYLFKSSDGRQVLQFRLDGFSFSRLRPYTQWEMVYEEARKLWGVYRAAVRPVRATRLATRYINSIEIPSKKFDYDDYFTAAPKVPEELPQVLSHFFTRLVIPFAEHRVTAIVVQTPSERPDPVNSTVILDIDVFAEADFGAEDSKIDEIFAILRTIKNKIFLSSITERAKELFR